MAGKNNIGLNARAGYGYKMCYSINGEYYRVRLSIDFTFKGAEK